MINAQEKPPLLNSPVKQRSAVPPAPEQTPPPRQVPPPVPGQIPPPPPFSGPVSQAILNNAKLAVNSAQKIKPYLTPGKIWIVRAPRGEVEVKGAILYDGAVVGVINFDPATGTELPKGYHSISFQTIVPMSNVKQLLTDIVKNLEILDGAEFREPESCWVIPVAYKGKIITEFKVYYDGVHIVPDYRAQQEMNAFGK
ncbi:hypothetical protein [Desulfurobacterium indicum]|uniref:Uncharacterized protein n=1 Tax=Desulfurobacterium indicum TaxID=1914305 RepID=A0A1R1MJK9_9BACT|nr:hypothetical protein [Desulfurobacterium indicum]OMH40005.1 hypothetical protein BLW93_07480 [Desulfurobacterium indicum]